MKKTIAIIFAIILLLTFAGCKNNTTNTESQVDPNREKIDASLQMITEFIKGKKEYLKNMWPKFVWEDRMPLAYEDMDFDLFYEQDSTYWDWVKSCIVGNVGENFKITHNIIEMTKPTDAEKLHVQNCLAEEYDGFFKIEYIEDIYKLNVEFTFKGDIGEDKVTYELYAIKTDGEWYILRNQEKHGPFYGYGMFYRYFMEIEK